MKGTCFNGENEATTFCDFRKNGLLEETMNMLDLVTWNLGSNPLSTAIHLSSIDFYQIECGNVLGNTCSYSEACNDTIQRNLTWKGYAGLINPSDYGYATSDRSCLTKTMDSSISFNSSCSQGDWLFFPYQWTLIPGTSLSSSSLVFDLNSDGFAGSYYASSARAVFPTVYLKLDVKLGYGKGTMDEPYELLF